MMIGRGEDAFSVSVFWVIMYGRTGVIAEALALYPFGYNAGVRPIRFLGDSLRCLRDFPQSARHDAGYQLDKVQRGNQPDDFKLMPAIGKGVEEIRVSDSSGVYRVI